MIDEILTRTEEILATAHLGLEDLYSTDRARRMSGLRNLVVFGRSVTFTLQNLSSKGVGFNEWYEPEQEIMKIDPLMRYFVELRNEILKQGRMNVDTIAEINSFGSAELSKMHKPPNAQSFFIGDEIGGSGWEIMLPDGSLERYYISLPRSVGVVKQVFGDLPVKKFPELEGRSVEDLSEEYLRKLSELVARAKTQFGTRPRPSGRPALRLVK